MSQGPLFPASYNGFQIQRGGAGSQNVGGAEGRDGARGRVGAGAPELNNVSWGPVMKLFAL